jgi:hypothetical protein
MNHITMTPAITAIQAVHDELDACNRDLHHATLMLVESESIMAGRFTSGDNRLYELRTANVEELADRCIELEELIATLEADQVIEPEIVFESDDVQGRHVVIWNDSMGGACMRSFDTYEQVRAEAADLEDMGEPVIWSGTVYDTGHQAGPSF